MATQGESTGPVELARDVLDALGRRDVARLIELADSQVEWHSFFVLAAAES